MQIKRVDVVTVYAYYSVMCVPEDDVGTGRLERVDVRLQCGARGERQRRHHLHARRYGKFEETVHLYTC